MSSVTTVLLMVPYIPQPVLERLRNETWNPERPFDGLAHLSNPATENDAVWGGSKYPEAEVFGGGFNHFDEGKFFTWLGGMDWGPWRATVLVAMSNPADSEGSWGAVNYVPFRVRGLDDDS